MTNNNFDSLDVATLRARNTLKWNWYGEDVLAMWVAEMDFPTAPAVMEGVRDSVTAESFGYPIFDHPALGVATAAWSAEHYGWTVNPMAVHAIADVLKGIELGIDEFTAPGSPVVLPTPAYPPFFDVIKLSGRKVVESPLVLRDGKYVLDLQSIDTAFAKGAGSLILCNPYNPVGRAFDREELLALSEVVSKHGGRVISDEIHAPLVFGRSHIPYASLTEETAGHTLTITAASKAWNLAGLKCAQVITSNNADEATWRSLNLLQTLGASTVGIAASIAAYEHGGQWLEDVMEYLEGNRELLRSELERQIPGARLIFPEATYMAWIDFSALELPAEPYEFFLEHAKVALKPGLEFGLEGKGHARINFATTRKILTESVSAMSSALVPATTTR